MSDDVDATAALQIADWRRRIAELYASVRHSGNAVDGWFAWRTAREQLFITHPQSPLPADARDAGNAPKYFSYDPALRVTAALEPSDATPATLPGSAGVEFGAVLVGTARFSLLGSHGSLAVFWLTDYAGGLLITFRDATSGRQTYGAGRYLLDTAKGADLGVVDSRLVLDFNFAYQPSCSYDPRWSCPLPPRQNWLDFRVPAGEKLAVAEESAAQ